MNPQKLAKAVRRREVVTAVDIGTTKVCAAIAEVGDDSIELLGTGWCPARGVRRGVIVNLSDTVSCVQSALEKAEKQAGTVTESAIVSIGGAYVRGVNTAGSTEVLSRGGEITSEDVHRAVDDARSFAPPQGSQVLHVLTRGFALDEQRGIANPVGMKAKELTVEVHLVLNASTVINNIVSAINKAGVVVGSVVMQQLASAEATLSDDEKDLGVLVVDIGGGTTDLVVYRDGSVCHSESFPIAGNLISRDIAVGLKTPLEEAETLKRTLASVRSGEIPDAEAIEVSEVGTGKKRQLSRALLCRIAQARCDEIFERIQRAMRSDILDQDVFTGVVLTGGGALLDGCLERAEEILRIPVRIGFPVNVVQASHEACHPAFCTGLGLIRYARDIRGELVDSCVGPSPSRRKTTGKRVKNWLMQKIG